MQGLIMAAQLITGISILVILHELGHFWAARAFSIRVEKFYLFFDAWGYKLFSFKRGDTEWGIGWLPLGGYVKIAGMIDESMDTEQLAKPPQPWEFRSKPAWQRLIVMVGGVVMNVIAGIFIFAMMTFSYGEQRTLNSSLVHGVVPSELAKEVGFMPGDHLVSINEKPIVYFEEVYDLDALMGDDTRFEIERNGSPLTLQLPKDFARKLAEQTKADFLLPRYSFYVGEVAPNHNAEKAGLQANDVILKVDSAYVTYFDEFQQILRGKQNQLAQFTLLRGHDTLVLPVQIDGVGKIGIGVLTNELQYDSVQFGFFQSFPKGIEKAAETISLQVKGWGKIFNGDIPANKAVQGPIGIAKFYGGQWIWSRFWLFTALISLGLAFMNILPIPALDGGHVVLLLIEMVTGRPLSVKAMERIQTFGMIILLSLMALIFGNDIWQLIQR